MELVIFDLDGTLLNQDSQISAFTRETLHLMQERDIAYTVATGRTLDSAHSIIAEHGFRLPHIYSNGVLIWDPASNQMRLDHCLTVNEVHDILATSELQQITPFISAVDSQHQLWMFHPNLHNDTEKRLLNAFEERPHTQVRPLAQMPEDIAVTNVSMIGPGDIVASMHQFVNDSTHLSAYSGPALEGNGLKWMDIHHRNANKGSAVETLKQELGASRIICFGDSDNDLSMFTMADESYAPDNAHAPLKAAATAVIGHHHEDGVAHYLRERFEL